MKKFLATVLFFGFLIAMFPLTRFALLGVAEPYSQFLAVRIPEAWNWWLTIWTGADLGPYLVAALWGVKVILIALPMAIVTLALGLLWPLVWCLPLLVFVIGWRYYIVAVGWYSDDDIDITPLALPATIAGLLWLVYLMWFGAGVAWVP